MWSIKPAELKDAAFIARLILESEENDGIAKLLIKNASNLEKFIISPNNIYSYKNTLIIEENGISAGMIFGYNLNTLKKASISTALDFIKLFGINFIFILPSLLYLEWITKINIDDYFLGNFIIEKNKRNKGLGTIIITHLENNCASKRMCVDVMANNINSIRLYKRLGYKINYTWDFGGKSHHRMIKVLKET